MIHAEDDAGWVGQENLQIRDTEISAWGGSSASYGIDIQYPAWIALDINGSKVWGHIFPTAYGIRSSGQGATGGATGIQGSSVVGSTHTVQAAGNVSIASTMLNGGPVTTSQDAWMGCMGVWDENGVFYAQGTCP